MTTPDYKAVIRDALAGADRSFADTGNTIEALGWIALAAKAGEPIPPGIGLWLHGALQRYTKGSDTMDKAMGLDKQGQGNPRRKHRAAFELNDVHGDMWFLIHAGADRTQAAALVAAATGRSVDTLTRSYGSSWFAKRADNPFESMPAESVRAFVLDMLAKYPDGTHTEQEKAAIMSKHPSPPAF